MENITANTTENPTEKTAESTVDLNTQKIRLTANNIEFCFEVSRGHYNKLVNGIMVNDKITPMHNFLVTTVADSDKHALLNLLARTPGAEIALGTALMEAYVPDLEVVVKKL